MKKVRQYNLELLRMISMIMIITMHMVNHSGLLTATLLNKGEYVLVWILFGFGLCSINIYLLISGYFLCESKFSISRVLKLAIQVITYSLIITLIFWIFTDVEHDKEYLVYSVLPILSDFYWFVSMYIGLYLLSPILNKLIHMLSKKQFKCTIAVALLLVSVWPNIVYYSSAMNTAGGVSISWFITVYLIGAYIRMYYKPDGKWTKYLLFALLVNLLVPLSKFFFEFLMTTPLNRLPMLDDLLWGYSVFYYYSSIPVTIASVLFFIAFLNLKINSQRVGSVINLLSGASFGVYLFHDHYYIREHMWNLINPIAWIGKWYLLPMCILTIIGIYIFGTVIEQIRQLVFKPLLNSQWFKESCNKIDNKLKKYWE